jgi:hypothetical protein
MVDAQVLGHLPQTAVAAMYQAHGVGAELGSILLIRGTHGVLQGRVNETGGRPNVGIAALPRRGRPTLKTSAARPGGPKIDAQMVVDKLRGQGNQLVIQQGQQRVEGG